MHALPFYFSLEGHLWRTLNLRNLLCFWPRELFQFSYRHHHQILRLFSRLWRLSSWMRPRQSWVIKLLVKMHWLLQDHRLHLGSISLPTIHLKNRKKNFELIKRLVKMIKYIQLFESKSYLIEIFFIYSKNSISIWCSY